MEANDHESLACLNQIEFSDLFLGPDFCEAQKAASDADDVSRLTPLDAALASSLRSLCLAEFGRRQTPEFGLRAGPVAYRVTVIDSGAGVLEFSLRKSNAVLRSFGELGLSPQVACTLLDPHLAGLVLIVGPSGVGKTTTAAALVVERLQRFGGFGRTIEQPIEIHFDGRHGHGRCRQIEVLREEDYDRELRLLLRTSARLILLGEIRTEQAARTAALAGTNGHLIISTMHAKSVEDGIERFTAMADGAGHRARDLVASGLALVLHQELQPSAQSPRLVTRSLSLQDERTSGAIRSKIRDGRIAALNQEIDQQHSTARWPSSAARKTPGDMR